MTNFFSPHLIPSLIGPCEHVIHSRLKFPLRRVCACVDLPEIKPELSFFSNPVNGKIRSGSMKTNAQSHCGHKMALLSKHTNRVQVKRLCSCLGKLIQNFKCFGRCLGLFSGHIRPEWIQIFKVTSKFNICKEILIFSWKNIFYFATLSHI